MKTLSALPREQWEPTDRIDMDEIKRRVGLSKSDFKCVECEEEYRKLVAYTFTPAECPKCTTLNAKVD